MHNDSISQLEQFRGLVCMCVEYLESKERKIIPKQRYWGWKSAGEGKNACMEMDES